MIKSALAVALVGFTSFAWAQSSTSMAAAAPDRTSQVPVTLTGGYETEAQDKGRPVILIASALKVPPEVFRKVFSGVKPAPAGQQPAPDQVRKNKQILLEGLSSYGITNERLDEISNYYRYRRGEDELWKHTDATAYATMRNGEVVSVTITKAGAGYTSPPKVSIPGIDQVKFKVVLSYGTDLASNGSIKEIKVIQPTEQ